MSQKPEYALHMLHIITLVFEKSKKSKPGYKQNPSSEKIKVKSWVMAWMWATVAKSAA